MAKRKYMSPVLFTLDDDGEEIISFGGSQGTSGYDSMFTFEDDGLEGLCGDYDDVELAEMAGDDQYNHILCAPNHVPFLHP